MQPNQHQIENRRRFLATVGLSGVGLLGAGSLSAEDAAPQLPLVDSPPVLQCPSENGITVVWAVGQPATGYVEFGTDPDRLDRTEHGSRFGLRPHHERFLQIRLEGLQPNTRYYYRTATVPFRFISGYRFERGDAVFGPTYSFTTPGPNKETGSFSVINDTHADQPTLKALTTRLAELKSDVTIWNGDLFDSVESADQVVAAVLRPGDADFATEKPVLFVPGNHDYRGVWARNLVHALTPWEHENAEDRPFGRNFAVRTGPLALVGLDTGEDKPDLHQAWQGMAEFEPYRIAQRDWLERTLKRPEIASAPFIVAFCHIPLFDPRPNLQDGSSLVREHYAAYQGQAAKLWGPVLSGNGVRLLVCAHQHAFRYDAPTEDRKWAQIVGGGPIGSRQLTVVHAQADNDTLTVAADELKSNQSLGSWTFKK